MTEISSPAVAGNSGTTALDALFQAVNRSDAPGLVAGVAQHGKTLYRRGFGLASVELGVANTPGTRMRIGSSSKHFTCLAALLLAEDGELNLDASVRRYIPELPPLDAEPSLRQLMTHTGGYRCHLDLGFIANGMAIQPEGFGLAMQLRQSTANFTPGTSALYCNSGYHLLSQVIARASGMPFEQFLQTRIFTPLGMLDTTLVPSDLQIHRAMATLHLAQADGRWQRGIFPSEEVLGEGGIISTLDDMLLWLAHLRNPKTLGSAATWAQMMALATLENGTTLPYALGLMRHDYRGVELIHHAGGVIGGSSQVLTVPSHELDVVIMTNGALVNPIALANQIVDLLLGDVLCPPASKPSTECFQALVGTRYHAPGDGRVIGFADVGGTLGLSFLNSPALPLADSGDTLCIGFQTLAVGPLSVPVGQLAELQQAPASLTFSEGGQAAVFERLPESPPSVAQAGAALLGHYHCLDLDADAWVRFDGHTLNLHVHGALGVSVMPLEALSTEVFSMTSQVPALSLFGIINLERQEGRVTGFSLDTLRTRHLHFQRNG